MPWAAGIALGAVVAPPDAVAATAVLRPAAAAASPPDDPRRREPAERRERAADLPAGRRRGRGRMASRSPPSPRRSCSRSPAAWSSARRSAWLLSAGAWAGCSTCRPRSSCSSSARSASGSSPNGSGLSGVLTMVCYAVTVARTAPERTPARIRIPTYAVWETVVFALNILAFIFIGLQIRPILDEPRGGRPRPVLRRRRRRARDGHRRATRVAHVVQRRHPLARPPFRVQPAAADAAADGRQRPGHLVVGHARHRLARGSAGAAGRRSRIAT